LMNNFEQIRLSFEAEQQKLAAYYHERRKLLQAAMDNTVSFVSTLDSLSNNVSIERTSDIRQAG
jgi:hypothetical protein